jgi:pimeloyl-ACP methyl ester carboxylesterase
MWDAQFAPLARTLRVVRYDMRGYGESYPRVGEFSHAGDLLALLEWLKIPRPVLVGCSKGGAAAIDLALVHPERVAGLVLVCAPPAGYEFEGEPPRQWEEMSAAFKKRDFVRSAELEVEIWVDGPRRTPDQVDPAIREMVREMDLIPLVNEANGLGSETWLEARATGRIHELTLPVLVMIGELDDPNVVRAGHWMAETIPGARIALFPTAAHLPNMEDPKKFNQLLLEFHDRIR